MLSSLLKKNRKGKVGSDKSELTVVLDGKLSKICLFGKDISTYVEEATIKIKPGEVAATLKLSNLDRATPEKY
jgi:hypothetical protein